MEVSPTKSNIPSFNRGAFPKNISSALKEITAPHINSFNYFIDYGLDQAVLGLNPVEINFEESCLYDLGSFDEVTFISEGIIDET